MCSGGGQDICCLQRTNVFFTHHGLDFLTRSCRRNEKDVHNDELGVLILHAHSLLDPKRDVCLEKKKTTPTWFVLSWLGQRASSLLFFISCQGERGRDEDSQAALVHLRWHRLVFQPHTFLCCCPSNFRPSSHILSLRNNLFPSFLNSPLERCR